jgi:hypothetical protein
MLRLLPLCAVSLLVACPPPTLPPGEDDPTELTVSGPGELLVGQEAQYTATAQLGGQTFEPDVTWSSSDDAVLLIDAAGFAVAIGAGSATVTAIFEDAEDSVDVTVTAPTGPPENLRYDSPVTYVVGASIAANAPRQDGGLVEEWAIFPSLPTGLLMDARTGVIAGTPVVEFPETEFTVTATNEDGEAQFAIRMSGVCRPNVAPPQDADAPDPSFIDENGDGVDGMACGPVFVSPGGNDANEGLRESPMRTIEAAIAAAAARNPIRDVYIARGTYLEQLDVTTLTSLIGGFDENWVRGPAQRARIEGSEQPLRVRASVELMDLEVRASDGAPHSVALLVEDAGVVRVRSSSLRSGRGEDGKAGQPGVSALLFGENGRTGDAGCEYTGGACGTCPLPAGGRGGFGPFLAADGGRGGAPGQAGENGEDGEDVGLTTLGGRGGLPGGDRTGADGEDGANGLPGQDGAGGGPGLDGANGTDGTIGRGGGGGGGGAGGDNFCNSYGGAGGGGGAGGEPGTRGTGGGGGGASIAIVSINTDLFLEEVDLESGRGGDGGVGGAGGLGIEGGFGGFGGLGEDDSGAGGDGGVGGTGGDGGHGGGGGGGHSIGVLIDDASRLEDDAVIFLQGTAGFAGGGPGEQGSRGDEGQIVVGSLD